MLHTKQSKTSESYKIISFKQRLWFPSLKGKEISLIRFFKEYFGFTRLFFE